MMLSEHADVIGESVAAMVAELIEAEVADQIGAEHGQRAPDRRAAQRNGYRTRQWKTRAGELELAIPKLRSGPAYFPTFLEPRKRSEQALVAVVQEAYVNGVSTRQDRAAGRAAGDRGDGQGPGQPVVRRAGRAGRRVSRAPA